MISSLFFLILKFIYVCYLHVMNTSVWFENNEWKKQNRCRMKGEVWRREKWNERETDREELLMNELKISIDSFFLSRLVFFVSVVHLFIHRFCAYFSICHILFGLYFSLLSSALSLVYSSTVSRSDNMTQLIYSLWFLFFFEKF